jgi:hypothetical protein
VTIGASMTMASIAYDLGVGSLQFVIQVTLTFFVVDRIIERRDERKRRALSGLAEAQAIESIDGLLTDGLPIECRTADPSLFHIGDATVALRVSNIRWDRLEHAIKSGRTMTLHVLERALHQHGDALRQPLNVSIIEPSLAPLLVNLAHRIEDCTRGLTERAEAGSTPEFLAEFTDAVVAMCQAAWILRETIYKRWM